MKLNSNILTVLGASCFLEEGSWLPDLSKDLKGQTTKKHEKCRN